MQERHQLRYVAVGRDQLIVDISRVRGRIPDAIETRQLRQVPDQLAQPPFSAVGTLAVISVDILSKQRDLSRATTHQTAGLGRHLHHRTRVFRASRIRDYAEAAEFITAFLDRKESAYALRGSDLGQEIDLRFRGKGSF